LQLLPDFVAHVPKNRSAGLCPGLWGLPAFFAGSPRHESLPRLLPLQLLADFLAHVPKNRSAALCPASFLQCGSS